MARYRNWRCPDCGGTFRDLQVLSDDPPPDRCALCGSWMSLDRPPEETFVPQGPGIRKSAYAQSVDQSYRAMEAASASRAEDAADQLRSTYRADDRTNPHEGDRALLDDFQKNQIAELKSGIKITNMKDPSEMRAGDTAVIQPSTEAARARLSIGPSTPGFQQFSGPPTNHAPGVGPSNAGDTIRQAVGGSHGQRAAQMINAGMLAPAYKE